MKTCKYCGKEFQEFHYACSICTICKDEKKREREKYFKQKYIKNGDNAYMQMKQRCENPRSKDYRFYGAKGVKVIIDKPTFCIFYTSHNTCEKCGCLLNTDKKSRAGKCVDRIDSTKNYEIGNLRILCRSCNTIISATKQFGKRPPKEEFIQALIINKGSLAEIAKIFNVTKGAVIRWFDKYGIERTSYAKV